MACQKCIMYQMVMVLVTLIRVSSTVVQSLNLVVSGKLAIGVRQVVVDNTTRLNPSHRSHARRPHAAALGRVQGDNSKLPPCAFDGSRKVGLDKGNLIQ